MSVDIFMFVVGAWFCFIFAFLYFVRYWKEQQQVQSYLSSKFDNYQLAKYKQEGWKRKLITWFDKFAPIGEKVDLLSDPLEFEKSLIKAGNPFGLTVRRLHGAKILGALIGFLTGFFLLILGFPFASFFLAFSPFLGYMFPIWGVRYLAKRRQLEIRYELPDFLDMMSITLQAGLGLDEALHYYVETEKGPLSDEFNRLNQEIRFGVQRETAFRSLMDRTSCPELDALIQSVIQAYNLGTPISETFAQQADEMRCMRAEQAKEAAGKAVPKITTVGSLIIAPSIMILIVGLLIINYFLSPNSPLHFN